MGHVAHIIAMWLLWAMWRRSTRNHETVCTSLCHVKMYLWVQHMRQCTGPWDLRKTLVSQRLYW